MPKDHFVHSAICTAANFAQILQIVRCEIVFNAWWNLQFARGLHTNSFSANTQQSKIKLNYDYEKVIP